MLDLTGWVANEPDGSVRCIAEARGRLEALLALEEGPTGALVDRVATDWGAASGQFHSSTCAAAPSGRLIAGPFGVRPPGPVGYSHPDHRTPSWSAMETNSSRDTPALYRAMLIVSPDWSWPASASGQPSCGLTRPTPTHDVGRTVHADGGDALRRSEREADAERQGGRARRPVATPRSAMATRER